jgi:hypothetical protein
MSTPFLDAAYNRVNFDRDLVFKFFAIFSLFECALKRAGFCTTGSNGEAQPTWTNFANSIHTQFSSLSDPDLTVATNYMLNFPVMQQIPHNNSLTFTPMNRRPNMNDTVWLSILVRGVRNNLFHGGKWEFDPTRDSQLLNHLLTILEVWAHLNSDIERELINVR